MSTLNPNEAPKGYMAKEISLAGSGCSKCAFLGKDDCADCECTGDSRQDGCEVYFVKKLRFILVYDEPLDGKIFDSKYELPSIRFSLDDACRDLECTQRKMMIKIVELLNENQERFEHEHFKS